MYILTATDYFTKWPKAFALKRVDSEELIKFLKDNIFSIFSVPDKFITDNGSVFIGSKFTEFCGEYGIIMGKSSNYYPQGNGLAESTNKTLIQILKKIIDKNQRNWNLKLTDSLWASKITPKDSIGMSPNTLVYEKEAKIPISLKLNALTFMVNTEDAEDSSPIQRRINQLLKLEEERNKALNRTSQRQQSIKRYFDQSATINNF
jgi:transposase InsO family protein